MTPEQILEYPPKILTPEQRQSYFDKGFLLVENLIVPEWIERLVAVTDEMVERSRSLTESDAVFDLEPDHTADNPRLRRLTSPVDQHPVYWEFASQSVLADVAADLVGPDVKYHHSKLNFKWSEGGEEVKWHQGHYILAAHQLQPLDLSARTCTMSMTTKGLWPGSPAATTGLCSISTMARDNGSAVSPSRICPKLISVALST